MTRRFSTSCILDEYKRFLYKWQAFFEPFNPILHLHHEHSSHCPEYAHTRNGKSEFLAHPDQENITICFEWLGRLDEKRRGLAWSYLTAPDHLQLMLNASGSDMVLLVAAARVEFNLPFNADESVKLPYDVIRMDDLEWCRAYFQEQKAKLFNPTTLLAGRDLDRLWLMFYATGDASFANKVKNVANGTIGVENAGVVLAAHWSYENHLNNGNRLADTAPPSVLQIVDGFYAINSSTLV